MFPRRFWECEHMTSSVTNPVKAFALIALGLNTALAVTIVYAILQYRGCG